MAIEGISIEMNDAVIGKEAASIYGNYAVI
jgi:hypothetical protein